MLYTELTFFHKERVLTNIVRYLILSFPRSQHNRRGRVLLGACIAESRWCELFRAGGPIHIDSTIAPHIERFLRALTSDAWNDLKVVYRIERGKVEKLIDRLVETAVHLHRDLNSDVMLQWVAYAFTMCTWCERLRGYAMDGSDPFLREGGSLYDRAMYLIRSQPGDLPFLEDVRVKLETAAARPVVVIRRNPEMLSRREGNIPTCVVRPCVGSVRR